MPRRKLSFVNGEFYHAFNRSVAGAQIFNNDNEYQRLLDLIDFYRFKTNTIRYSYFMRLPSKSKVRYLDSLYGSSTLLNIVSFCIMPNHFHFLLKQNQDSGISKFMRFVQNGFAKYYNLKSERHGALFQNPFKAVLIESKEQLLHTSRYIHLNPYSSGLISSVSDLREYPWTSFMDYTSNDPRKFLSLELESFFKNKKDFEGFVYNQADYQRSLQSLKHIHTPGV